MRGIFKIALILCVFLFGCAGKGKKAAQDSLHALESNAEKPTVPQNTLDFKAHAKGNQVFIRIINNTPKSIRVSPFFFALIVNNKKPEVRFDPSNSQAEFPVTKLTEGMMANGMIRFDKYQDLVGQKLVFNSPDYKPMMTFIDEYEPEVK